MEKKEIKILLKKISISPKFVNELSFEQLFEINELLSQKIIKLRRKK